MLTDNDLVAVHTDVTATRRRVFADKLISYEDKNWLEKTLFDLMRESFTPDLIRQVTPQEKKKMNIRERKDLLPDLSSLFTSAHRCLLKDCTEG